MVIRHFFEGIILSYKQNQSLILQNNNVEAVTSVPCFLLFLSNCLLITNKKVILETPPN